MDVQIRKTRWFELCVGSGIILTAVGCSTTSDAPNGRAGAAGSSGDTGGAGGSTVGSGGSNAGGSNPGGSGGGNTGGATTGGTAGKGGGAGTGGAATGGSAGTSGAGGSGITDAGSKADASDAGRSDVTSVDVTAPPADASTSSGCGAATWPASGNFSIDVGGTMRAYIVKIPAAYATSKPHKLIFAWHGLGGTAQQIAQSGYYGLETLSAGSSIFVSGQGLDTGGGAGWPNTGGQDVNFVKALVDWMKKNYCVDETRIFSTGMSYGGIMSNTLGCQMGNVFRAIAPIAGSGPFSFGASPCLGQPVAAWLAHGTQDTVVTYDAGLGSREHWKTANHCGPSSTATPPAGCVSYEGCNPGYPVHWCAFDGGHTVPSFAPQGIWNFLNQF